MIRRSGLPNTAGPRRRGCPPRSSRASRRTPRPTTTVDVRLGRRYLTPAFFERVAHLRAPPRGPWRAPEGRIVASAFNVKANSGSTGAAGAPSRCRSSTSRRFYHGVERCDLRGSAPSSPRRRRAQARGASCRPSPGRPPLRAPRLRAAARDFCAGARRHRGARAGAREAGVPRPLAGARPGLSASDGRAQPRKVSLRARAAARPCPARRRRREHGPQLGRRRPQEGVRRAPAVVDGTKRRPAPLHVRRALAGASRRRSRPERRGGGSPLVL